MKKTIKPNLPLLGAISLAISAFLAACGGGGGSNTPDVPKTATPITVVDGLIKGAIVCVDANGNGACDTSETQGTTDASGAVTLNIPTADVGKYPILAVVPATAVDMDDAANTVGTGYTLKTTADNPSVITPLTTLIQHQVEQGYSSADAVTALQNLTGVTNVFANFVATPDANARVIAKTIVSITQDRLGDAALTAKVGQNDPITGKPITQADLDVAIRTAVIQALPTIVATVSTHAQSGGACADPTASNWATTCKGAINAAVTGTSTSAGLAAGTGVTATTLGTLVGVAKSASSQTDAAPAAGATLKWLKFTDANNYYYRAYESTLAENTFDANDLRRFRDIRMTATAGTVTSSGGLINQGRADDVHWNGLAWVTACNNTAQYTATKVDANGASVSNFCDNYAQYKSTTVKVDYSGKTIAEMVAAIRAYPSTGDGLVGVGFAGWGASDSKATTALAAGFSSTATLPIGSALHYVTSTQVADSFNYIVSGSGTSYVPIAPAAVAAGGSSASSPLPACVNYLVSSSPAASTLVDLIAQNKGTPCILSPSTVTGLGGVTLSSGSTNENWHSTTLSIGTIGSAALATNNLAANASSYYTGNTVIRVGFPAGTGQVAAFYSCQQRYDGLSRNCIPIGNGTYVITKLGDADILSFSGVPNQAAPLPYRRVFVQRAGVVRYGYINKATQTSEVRPNLAATNALFNVLGIPAITP